jgi:hypothetical protein
VFRIRDILYSTNTDILSFLFNSTFFVPFNFLEFPIRLTSVGILKKLCCVSWMFMPDPDLFTTRILDPPRKEERFEIPSRRLAKYFTKLKILNILGLVQKKIFESFDKEFKYFFTKISARSSDIWVLSGIRKRLIPDPGAKKGHRISAWIRNTPKKCSCGKS